MTYDFDRVIDRRSTDSNKWRKYPPDVLPLWVADMDFASPEPVVRALRERVEHGVYGYGFEEPSSPEVFVDRLQKRYGWKVSPEAVVMHPGRHPRLQRGLPRPAPAGRRAPHAGAGLSARSSGRRATTSCTRDEAPLGRGGDGRYVVDLDAFARGGPRPHARLPALQPAQSRWAACSRATSSRARADLPAARPVDHRRRDPLRPALLGPAATCPIASLGPEIEQRTITLMAPSKTFNLAGLKVSVAVIPNAPLRERFVAARVDYVQTQVNVLGYAAAFAAYRDGDAWLDELLRYLEANRDYLADYVRRHLPGVTMTPPEGTYLAWLDCRSAGARRRRPLHVLPRAREGGAQRRGALRPGRPGLRAAQLRLAALDPDRGAGADAPGARRLSLDGP